ncbi:arginine/agmatine antiporter [Novosphingobium sp. BL-8A]|uniref:arginine/agmatine antiporter n=1 Tax=Novosphingobium sp. BL-8A TaxID=3127639 RepID=UPI003757F2F1
MATAAADDGGNKIGLVPATLMVAGNMMGSGVFMLPANLSAIGSIALIGWLLTVVGAVALALVFAKLSAIDPAAGGPYAYARKAYGDYMGYQTNLIYWLANVVGNVALAVAGLGYLSHFFPALKVPIVMAFGSIAIIWFFAYANILGPKVVGRLQSFTTVFALVPIFGMALFGWFWFNPQTFSSAWNVSGQSSPNAVMATLTFTLWAFIGVESASVSAGVVANPSRNVPIATVGGVVLASVAYVLSSSVIMGMIPNKELVASSAPFADAARLALGDFAGSAVALCAAVGCLGSLAGWTLLVGQSAKAAADDGLFPGIFAKVNKRGVPSLGLVIVAVIMSVQVLATMSPTASQQFGKIASIAVIMTLLPYIYSCIAIKVLGYGKMPHGQYTFFVAAGLAGAIYCMIALVGSDGEQTRWSLIFVIATIVFYSASITRKRDLDEKHIHPGGKAPVWVRYLALGVTVVALVVMFWLSVGRHNDLDLHSRAQAPTEAGETAQQMAPSGAN